MRTEQTYVRYEKFSYIKDFQQKEKSGFDCQL